ncbi:MAG TPA: hypothetical protein VMG34_01985 [Bacteroidota bacterium]|nr:hypothetical protein [Bacteroidota bacterium]
MRSSRIFVLSLLMAASVAGQTPDTARDAEELHQLVFPGSPNSLSRPSLLPLLRPSDFVMSREFPESSLGYLLVSQPARDKGADLSWQLKLNSAPDDPLSSVRMVLSGASAAGVAYLAYQHIKKYGFLK